MLCGGQNTYDHVSHYVIDSIKDVFSLLVVTSLLVSPQNFGNYITKIRIKSLGYITSRGPNNALKNQKASMREKLEANFGNDGTSKKRQTTALDVSNNVAGDVLKESSHTTGDKTKNITHI